MPNSYQEFASALGEMIISFQELENFLLELFASLVNESDREIGLMIGSTMSFGNLCKVTEALSIHKFDDADLKESLAETLKKCQQNESERNTFIHSFYPAFCFGDSVDVIGRFKHKINKKGYALHSDENELEKLRNLNFEFTSRTRELLEISKSFGDS
jgi:hypothetical protein